MPREQLSITVPAELAERAQALVAAGEANSLSGYISGALAQRLEADERRRRWHTMVDSIIALPPDDRADAAAERVVAVIHAQAAALAWVRDTTGVYPAPRPVSDAVAAAAAGLRTGDDGDAAAILHRVAARALADYEASQA